MSEAIQVERGQELRVDNLSVKFGDARVLSSVSLSIAHKDFVSVVGASGCGKTTLLNAVAGFIPPTQGQITRDGIEVVAPGPDRAMVFQEDAVFPWYTVRRNVEYALRVAKLDNATVKRRVDGLLNMVGLLDRAEAWPRQLSGGQRKRVDLARALASEPHVLLMDEPFAALDAMTKARMQIELMRFVDLLGVTVLFITHDLEEAVLLSDRVVVMGAAPGRIVAEVPVPLPRPRSPDMRTSEALQTLRRKIYGLLGEHA